MSQSVVLISDVPGLGQVGDLCQVKDGFARNYLLPQGLAVLATPNTQKKFERQKDKLAKERERQLTVAQGLSTKINNVGLVFERPVGPGGRLFGSVTPLDIISELAKQGAPVAKKSVLMDGPLKTPGDHVVRVRIHSQVVVDVPVKIAGKTVDETSEGPLQEDEPAPEEPEEETKE